jgi:type IX secretion system PorP/SprF family membrane protein
MKKLIITFVFFAMTTYGFAQQIPEVSHFMYDNLRTNPGSTGSNDMVCVSLIGRNGMTGFPGSPSMAYFNAEAPFNLFGAKHGVGLSIFNDAIGFNSDIQFTLNYAYRFTIGDATLGIGLNGGFIDKTLKPEWEPPEQPNDPNVPTGDADMTFNLGAGIFYRSEEIFFGISALNLTSPEVVTPTQTEGGSESTYNLNRHYYVTAGYNMQLNNPAWELKPAVLLKSDEATTEMDLNLTVVYNKKFWGGVSYRTGSAVIGMAGFELMENLKVGYSYDFHTSALTKYSNGTHEILINYCFKLGVEKAPQKYKSIRYL